MTKAPINSTEILGFVMNIEQIGLADYLSSFQQAVEIKRILRLAGSIYSTTMYLDDIHALSCTPVMNLMMKHKNKGVAMACIKYITNALSILIKKFGLTNPVDEQFELFMYSYLKIESSSVRTAMLNAIFQSLSMELLPRFICLLIDLECTNIHVAKTVQILLLASLKHDVGTDGLINEKLQALNTQAYQIQAAIRRREDTIQPPPRKRQKLEPLNESCLKLGIEQLDMRLVGASVDEILSRVSVASWSSIIQHYISSNYAKKCPSIKFDDLNQPPSEIVNPNSIDIHSPKLESESQMIHVAEPVIVKEINVQLTINRYNDEISKPTIRNLVKVYAQLLNNAHQTLEWRKLITKYAVQFKQLKTQLLDFVCEDFVERWEVALMWMYVDVKENRKWFKEIVERVELGEMEQFLTESPVLVLNFDREKWQNEIGLIDRLCRARSCVRDSCINGLLQFSNDADRSIRVQAILALRELFADGFMSMMIENRATRQFMDASKETSDISRFIELYLVLCGKKVVLLERVFDAFIQASETNRKVFVECTIPLTQSLSAGDMEKVFKMMLQSKEGSEDLCLSLFPGVLPDWFAVEWRMMVDKRKLPVKYMIPLIGQMNLDETKAFFTKLASGLDASDEEGKIEFESVVRRMFIKTSATDILLMAHLLEESLGLKRCFEVTTLCLRMTDIFNQDVCCRVYQKMLDLPKIPTMTLKSITTSLTTFPSMQSFTIGLMHKMVSKKIWTNDKLFEGFIRLCVMNVPGSFKVISGLPRTELKRLFIKSEKLKSEFAAFYEELSVNDRKGYKEMQDAVIG